MTDIDALERLARDVPSVYGAHMLTLIAEVRELRAWKARHKPAVSAAYAILDTARPLILNAERLKDAS